MRFYLEDMIGALDLQARGYPHRRDGRFRCRSADSFRPAGRRCLPRLPELSPSGQTLEKAEELYLKRSLDDAKNLYLKSLEQRGSAVEHAQAWYGLARIAVLQKQPDAAVKLFEKTLGASPDDPTRAWSWIYLARLSDSV